MYNLTDKIKQLIKTGFFHIFGSSVINKIVAFLSNVVLVRILSKSEYGIFTYSWNIYSILLLLNGLGIESGVLQVCSEWGNDKEKIRKNLNLGVKIGTKFDILLGIIIFEIGCLVNFKIKGADTLLKLMCLLPMIKFLYALISSVLLEEKRNKEYSELTMFNTMMIFICASIGALVFRERGMIFGYYIAYSSSVIMAMFKMKIKIFQKCEPSNLEEKRTLLSISVVSMCNNGLSQLMYLLDVFVLGVVAANENILASYKVATTIPAALSFIPVSIITYIYPYFAEHRKDGKWCLERYKQVLKGVAMMNFLISTILFVLAPFIIHIMYGKEYLDAVPVFRILSMNYFFSGTFRVISGNLLVTQRKLKFNLFVALVSGIINALSDFYFIQWWGSIGAAVATILVVFVSGVMSTIYLIITFKKIVNPVENP